MTSVLAVVEVGAQLFYDEGLGFGTSMLAVVEEGPQSIHDLGCRVQDKRAGSHQARPAVRS